MNIFLLAILILRGVALDDAERHEPNPTHAEALARMIAVLKVAEVLFLLAALN